MEVNKVPVLLVIFNRPDTTKQVIEALKAYKPTKLYIASDGPRIIKENEKEVVEQTRELVLNSIDWDCSIKQLFRKTNVGCAEGVSSAISWFFEKEEMGIILEDDCVPSSSFFKYCEELLFKFENDTRIGSISGFNSLGGGNSSEIFYSKYIRVWGWATWRRAWDSFRFKDHNWDIKEVKEIFQRNFGLLEGGLMYLSFKKALNANNSWAYFWNASCLLNSYLTVVPKSNLILNVGIEHDDSTNTKRKIPYSDKIKQETFLFPIKFPEFIHYNVKEDARFSKLRLKTKSISLLSRIFIK